MDNNAHQGIKYNIKMQLMLLSVNREIILKVWDSYTLNVWKNFKCYRELDSADHVKKKII